MEHRLFAKSGSPEDQQQQEQQMKQHLRLPRASKKSLPPILQPQVVLNLQQQKEDSPQQQGGAAGGPGGAEDTGSLYSDDIPSGYNSGEQYDTISTGYMSGEAYELPESRLDLLHREPALDKIDECVQPLRRDADDDDIFVLPMPSANPATDAGQASPSSSSSSSPSRALAAGGPGDTGGGDDVLSCSPPYAKLLRKKVTTFSIPIENAPLPLNADDDDDEDDDDEDQYISSDPDPGVGTAANTVGYSGLPSDTDTSAFDSDANALVGDDDDANASGGHSGTELLSHASQQKMSKAARLAARKAKKLKKHDEEWFAANDNKYWAGMRFLCFWGSLAAMVSCTILAAVMIYLMPSTCDPENLWYQGTVSIDVDASQLGMEADRMHVYRALGVQTLHLKNLTAGKASKNYMATYRDVIGANASAILADFVATAHRHNLSVVVQVLLVDSGEQAAVSLDLDLNRRYTVAAAITFWTSLGADGIFIDGLEHYEEGRSGLATKTVTDWEYEFHFEEHKTARPRVFLTSYDFARREFDEGRRNDVDLLDVKISWTHANVSDAIQKMLEISSWDALRSWISWNLDGVASPAALAVHMMLPGTINLGRLPADAGLQGHLANLSEIRAGAVPIYMNANYKRCGDCESGTTKESNIKMSQPVAETPGLVQLERFYSRRNRYVLLANLDPSNAVSLEAVGKIYSVGELLWDSTGQQPVHDEVDIGAVNLEPGQAVLVKLPK